MARRTARQQLQSAIRIQAAWRGYRSRSATQQRLLGEWQDLYAPAAGQAEAKLTAQQILEQLVPLLLGSLMPLWSRRTRQLLANGSPLGLSPARRVQPGAAEQAAAAVAAGSGPSPDNVARGSLLLLMRSMTNSEPMCNYCTAACSADVKVRPRKGPQCYVLESFAMAIA